MAEQDDRLLELVKTLTTRVESLEAEVKSLRLLNTVDVPEETMVAIAAAVAAYLGLKAKKRTTSFGASRNWQVTTRESQLQHTPLYLR